MSRLSDFIKRIFGLARTGLQRFLAENQEEVAKIVDRLARKYKAQPFGDWKDEAFAEVARRFQRRGLNVPDTWIVIALHLAYDAVKQRIEARAECQS